MAIIVFPKESRPVGVTLGFLCIFFIIISFAWNAPPYSRYGDSTYFLQIISFATDGDIQYSAADFNRINTLGLDDLPAGMELIKNNKGEYFYAKEYTYALFSAPFYMIGGYHGVLVFNGFLFILMILMGYILLRQLNDVPISFLGSALFFSFSTVIVYLFWIHLELYAMCILMASLLTCFFSFWRDDIRILALSGILFGISSIVRPWHFFFFIPFLLYFIFCGRWKKSVVFSLSFLISILIIIIPFFALTGTLSFYGGERYYYSSSPYPFEESYSVQYEMTKKFDLIEVIISNPANSFLTIENVLYVVSGYFIGRFTGIFLYYPFSLLAILSFVFVILSNWINRDLQPVSGFDLHLKFLVFVGILTSILFIFAVKWNGNYFGGSGAVGNRYFTIYPAFLFLLGKIDPKKLAIFSILALIVISPVIFHPIETSKNPVAAATSFPFPHFPLEYPSLFCLPIGYDNKYLAPTFAEIKLTGEEVNATNYFSIRDRTELIFFSNRPIGNLSFVVYAEIPGNIHASMKGMAISRTLEPRSAQIVTFDSLIPEYRSRNYHVYSLVVHPDIPVIMVPFSMNGEIIEQSYFTGWYPPEDWEGSGIQTRWMDREASVITIRNESRPGVISFQLASFYQPRNVLIFEQETLTTEARVEPFFSTFHVPSEGFISILRFSVPGGGERPAGIPELENPDTRNLSIALRNVTGDGRQRVWSE